ncbi:Reverse transcriptase, RNA-dependent DNA polymerase [Niveomyces insectorum RCEF 264]|uniref:Reverse transcriptase, RNA-dependent DNA polymerase n=1 Tax=Niveomyces insectorum RCEF 264 TaxID=1081102 RepID=A0A167X5Q8_9HYPO|nr:Reverse transcriptase, RNA-dependent DNA polymerase [Niveomyces insectorum RCEF 264]
MAYSSGPCRPREPQRATAGRGGRVFVRSPSPRSLSGCERFMVHFLRPVSRLGRRREVREGPRAHQWEKKRDEVLASLGFYPTVSDKAVYVKGSTIIVTYVDDILYTGDDEDLDEFEEGLTKRLEVDLAGESRWLLGVEIGVRLVEKGCTEVFIHQNTYLQSLLEE